MLRTILFLIINSQILSAAPIEIISGEKIGIAIMGSITQKNPEENVVLVKLLDSGKVQALRSGHKLKDGYIVVAIDSTSIDLIPEKNQTEKKWRVFKEGFAPKESSLPKPSPETPVAKSNFSPNYKEEGFERNFENGKGDISMTQDYRKKMLTSELPKILMQASAEAVIRDKAIIGFSLDQIESGSIFEKSGLQDGDIVTSIGGQALTDVSYTIKLLNSLKNADSIEFEIERGGIKIPVTISVK